MSAEEAATSRTGWLRRRRRASVAARGETPVDRTSADAHDDAAGVVVDLTDETFENGTVGGWTVVAFWAAWCGPCRAFRPVFDEVALAETTEHLRFARCDVDASRRTAHAWGIATVPTVSLFDPDGNEIQRIVGVPPYRALQALIDLTGGRLPANDPKR